MKAIFGIFTNRWFLSILGLLALALIILIIGPLISIGAFRPLETATAQWITILVIVVLWALNQLRKQIKASKATNQMVEGLVAPAGEAEPDLPAEEVAALKERFEDQRS